ncbi:MAG: hypothetical protein JO344_10340 [Planctomycetaceae bacterium]|nr:hypothetical protein [Planctomycetaceae bacterium]
MTLNEFAREMGRRPFRPFQLVLVDGRSFTVDHPEFASTDRRGRVVTFHAGDNTRHEIDSRLIAEIVAVDSVEEEPTATPGPGPNGGE